jgi:hypothetical protein
MLDDNGIYYYVIAMLARSIAHGQVWSQDTSGDLEG